MRELSLDNYPDLLTIKHLEELLDQSAATIRKLCREGELPSIRIGRRIYVPKSEFVAHIMESMG